jgi:hypothetical protein
MARAGGAMTAQQQKSEAQIKLAELEVEYRQYLALPTRTDVRGERDREEKRKHLAKILSVSEGTIRRWLSRIDKESRDAWNKRIFEIWLACGANSEVAKPVVVSKDQVRKITRQLAGLPKVGKAAVARRVTNC